MLRLNSVSVLFGIKKALDSISVTIEQGDFIVIVGTNGAGKSTLFDVIAGTIEPTHGSIELNGTAITQSNELQRSSFITRLFQNTRLNSVGTMTVHENLAMALYSRRSATLAHGMQTMPRAQAQELIAPLTDNVDRLLDTPMNALSGGQRQLIAFIMSTLHIPTILLLDEPTAALDPNASTKLLKFASSFIEKNKVTTLMITHDPYIALSLGNKIWVLENGVITKQYSGAEKIGLNPNNLIGHIDYNDL